MSNLVVSRQVDILVDRKNFIFLGLPRDCEATSFIADQHGWNVVDSGVIKDGAWITLAKFTTTASSFPELYHGIDNIDVIGRLAPEVAE